MTQVDYKYWAFISYSHADEAWAKWLHKSLETYRVPRRLVGLEHPDGLIPARLHPVFRDRDELPSSHELGAVINRALRESRYLIVICSPASASSRWVEEEIKAFKRLGREERVLALIVDGEPHAANPALESFPPALKVRVDAEGELSSTAVEPIAADARPFADHKHGARLKLIAGMLGLGYDELVQRERQRRRWQRVQQVAAGFAALAVLAGVVLAFDAREARRVESARLDRLVQLGRQELLDLHHARAAVYLTEALRGGRDTPALRYWLARAMQPVDAVEAPIVELGEPVLGAALNADGSRLLVWKAGVLEWWDWQHAKRLQAVTIPLQKFLEPARIVPGDRYALASGVAADGTNLTNAESATAIVDLLEGRLVTTTTGHLWAGAGLRTSPDGQHALLERFGPVSAGVAAPRIVVHAIADGRKLAELTSAEGTAIASFSADGQRILTGGEGSGAIRIWDAQTYRLLKTIQPRQAIPHGAYWSGRDQEIIGISEAGAIKLWDGRSGELLDALGGHSLYAIAWASVAGRYWLTSSVDGARVWDLTKGQQVFASADLGGFSADLAMNPSGTRMLSAEDFKGPSLWSIPERMREHLLDLSPAANAALLFTPDDRRIVSIDVKGRLRTLRTAALTRPLAYLEHGDYRNPLQAPGVDVLLSEPGGSFFISGGADGFLRRWDAVTGVAFSAVQTHEASIQHLAYVAGAGLVLALDTEGLLVAWDGKQTTPRWQRKPQEGESFKQLSFTGASPHAALLAKSGRVTLVDVRSGESRNSFDLPGKPESMTLLDEGRLLCVLDQTGRVETYDTADGRRRGGLGTGLEEVSAVTEHAAKSRVALGHVDGTLSLWDARSGVELARLPGGKVARYSALRFSEDGQQLAAGAIDGSLLLWQLSTNTSRQLSGHQSVVLELAFSPSSELLASSSIGEMLLWETGTGQLLERLGSYTDQITNLAFDHSGTRLVHNLRLDPRLRLWGTGFETRAEPALRRRLDCAVPWQLEGTTLKPREPDPAACN